MATNDVAELRRQISEGAPKMLQALKDDRSGKKPMTASQKKAAMILLRKVMTAAQIREALSSVPAAKPSAKRARSK